MLLRFDRWAGGGDRLRYGFGDEKLEDGNGCVYMCELRRRRGK